MNEMETFLEKMKKDFDRDFKYVTDTYVGKIREIREKFSFEIRGGKQDVRNGN